MAKIVTGINMMNYRFFHTGKICSKNIVIRKPIKVLNLPTKIIETNDAKPLTKLIKTANNASAPAIIKKPEENVVPYEKLSKYDSRFIKTISMIKDRTRREKSGKILLEGKRLINDAIEAGMQLRTLYFSREEDLKAINIKEKDPKEVEVFKVLFRTLKVWSNLTSCPGVFAVFKRPSAEELKVLSSPTLPVTVLCDNIREPGNLGSIIRNAAAAGCKNILLTKGCVDPWEMKVLRAGSGGHFRIPIVNNIEWSQISNYIPSNSTIIVADNSADIEETNLGPDFINYDECIEKEEEEETKYFTCNEQNEPIRVDESFDSSEEIEKYKEIPLPCNLYSSLKYPKNNIVLYIGGETCGVDPRIVKLACEFGGKKVKIPMDNGMESLNSAFAMTIVLYEIKRQLSQVFVVAK